MSIQVSALVQDNQIGMITRVNHIQRFTIDDPEACTANDQCNRYPYYVCDDYSDDLDSKICKHKDVFPPEALEVVGVFVFGFIMALCTVAGIGGGGASRQNKMQQQWEGAGLKKDLYHKQKSVLTLLWMAYLESV